MHMPTNKQTELAHRFRNLNQQGHFLLANAWDIASARIFEEAGFPAIGTTSGGIAYAHGYRDGQLIKRDEMLRHIAAIVGAVAVPVTADIEAGYGASPQAVANTVQGVIEAGAVGINLEDNSHGLGVSALFGVEEQSARIAAARTAARQTALPLWINARTDTYLLGLGDDAEARFAMTVARANAYLAAGADMVFVPVLTDSALIKRMSAAVSGPISLMAMPGAPSAAELFAAGAQRVSLGVCPMLAAMGAIRDIACEVRAHGTWQAMQRSFYGFAEAEALFAAP
ncbi:isocitrate lyase/phosphoenolpyruvate mutase family protein [Collimonas sp.]|jgi:2-methylisocitrate lyase-like PEP mutase family enzyme|uniref:isocitrate lyase/PEP mutase family protein n=1 Tax=Collimonas sp. TaxID=1963772 RepID=UPI002CD4D4DC|nr:isocitrate lyase/phosphoenolpyruvate mutase family protein [Collimonas sp.]HWW07762.1 isocitrate lyase/phosphoenolpyruvate mutase family protein [Collimonas sp.]